MAIFYFVRSSQEGAALGRGDAAILRPARQAGQLPGRGELVAGQPRCQPAGRLSALSAGGLGPGPSASGQGQSAGETVAFQTKPEIALGQIKAARAAGLPEGVVLMDAGYGNDTGLRTEITALGLRYVAGIGPNTSVWPPGMEPLPPQRGRGSGRPPKLLRRDDEHQPISVKALALGLPAASVANHYLARGQRRLAHFALRTAEGATSASRYQAERAARRRVAADRVAARRNRADEILVCHPCPRMSPLISWSTSQNCAGGSSAIIRNSNRSLALAITKGAGGAASTITRHSVSPPTAS